MANDKLPRVFIDANVLISGLVFPRWPHELLRHSLAGDFVLVLCLFVIAETQKRITNTFPNYLPEFEDFIKTSGVELVPSPSQKQVDQQQDLVRDKKDIPVALAAINAKGDYFVSNDKDFTARDETTKKLRKYLTPLLVGTFLKEVMGWSSDKLEAIRYRTWQNFE